MRNYHHFFQKMMLQTLNLLYEVQFLRIKNNNKAAITYEVSYLLRTQTNEVYILDKICMPYKINFINPDVTHHHNEKILILGNSRFRLNSLFLSNTL